MAENSAQGLRAEHDTPLDELASAPVLAAMLSGPCGAGLAGAAIARVLFKKHFEKAGLV